MTLRLAVFASGGGTNLQSLIDHFNTRQDDGRNAVARVVLVISDREDAGALDRARRANVDTVVIPVSGRPIDFVARETLASLESADVDLIALAGYLRLVPPAVVRHFRNRMLNIHPALLPSFGGKGMFGIRVHRAVLAAGATISGPTVHLVDERYDEGRIVAQWPVPVLRDDTPESLAKRVLAVEHQLYPVAIEAFARALAESSDQTGFAAGEASFAWSEGTAIPVSADFRKAFQLD